MTVTDPTMTEQARPACPECGDGAWVRQLREVLPRLRAQVELAPGGSDSSAGEDLIAGVESDGDDAQAPPSDRDHSHHHDHGDDHAHSHGGWLLGAGWELLFRAVRRLLVRPLAARHRRASSRRARDRSAREVEHLERLVKLYPGLCFCERHRVMFLAGGSRTMRLEQAGPLLARGDERGLAALLREPSPSGGVGPPPSEVDVD